MKIILLFMTVLLSLSSFSTQLDLRKLQSPVLDAQTSYDSGFPSFTAYLTEEKKRLPGVNGEQRRIISNKYRVKLLNEYRLYDKSVMDYEEKIALERYCTRYNRRLLQLLGL